jgi:SAM-dependent methyltransferase
MNFKTDYYNIHERKYQTIKVNNGSWSSEEEMDSFISIVLDEYSKFGIKSGNLLDLGSGDGQFLIKMAKNGFNLYGAEISPTAIELSKVRAIEQGIDLTIYEGSVVDYELPKDKFDLVVDSLCFHCIIGDDRGKFLTNVRSSLKNSGIFIGATMCGKIPKELKGQFEVVDNTLIRNGVAGRYIGKSDEILKEIKNSGFTILSHKIISAKDRDYENDTLIYVAK